MKVCRCKPDDQLKNPKFRSEDSVLLKGTVRAASCVWLCTHTSIWSIHPIRYVVIANKNNLFRIDAAVVKCWYLVVCLVDKSMESFLSIYSVGLLTTNQRMITINLLVFDLQKQFVLTFAYPHKQKWKMLHVKKWIWKAYISPVNMPVQASRWLDVPYMMHSNYLVNLIKFRRFRKTN